MPAQIERPPQAVVIPEIRPQPIPAPSPKTQPIAGRRAYWGDRLTFQFWLFCFALMGAMALIELVRYVVVSLFGSSPP